MNWLRIAFKDAITHAVSASLLPLLVADMAERGHPIENYEERYGHEHAAALKGNPTPITGWALDCGGYWIQGEPVEDIAIDGLTIGVPCAQFAAVLQTIENAKIRRFSDGTWYYKLKFWVHATVLTVEQHDAIERELQQRMEVARSREREFDAARKRGTAGVS